MSSTFWRRQVDVPFVSVLSPNEVTKGHVVVTKWEPLMGRRAKSGQRCIVARSPVVSKPGPWTPRAVLEVVSMANRCATGPHLFRSKTTQLKHAFVVVEFAFVAVNPHIKCECRGEFMARGFVGQQTGSFQCDGTLQK